MAGYETLSEDTALLSLCCSELHRPPSGAIIAFFSGDSFIDMCVNIDGGNLQ